MIIIPNTRRGPDTLAQMRMSLTHFVEYQCEWFAFSLWEWLSDENHYRLRKKKKKLFFAWHEERILPGKSPVIDYFIRNDNRSHSPQRPYSVRLFTLTYADKTRFYADEKHSYLWNKAWLYEISSHKWPIEKGYTAVIPWPWEREHNHFAS